ncbi:hypothetical protein SAMN05443637_11182 [Pseudonocardia thermophila]|mgnify:CR=1 FL=1|uniref:Uncharacterized protein n=1 Tax=Pseudonocardia thermophila TaxID=1848 RepID=A0A1M6UXX2_PSETH|nr:hypothetical protein [Pseudonocardia thermophila]SHK74102.1 hypothetical protein SAMN05443637_11182 [Pseudonocardia thermophila]
MKIRTGQRLRSATCDAEVMVLRAPADDVDLRCGGHPVHDRLVSADPAPLDDAFAGGTELGKRYVNEDGSLELLCVHAGKGSLSVGSTPLQIKSAQPLPASD